MLALLQIVVFIGVDIPYALYVMIAAIAVVAAGWGMLIMAALQRARWARANPIGDVPISIADAPRNSPNESIATIAGVTVGS